MEKTYKIFGRTHDSLMKKKVNFGEYQCVKKKQRSTITIDHIFFVKKVIAYNQKSFKQNTYMLIGDDKKYFDKLCLQDCIMYMMQECLKKRQSMCSILNKDLLINIATRVKKLITFI